MRLRGDGEPISIALAVGPERPWVAIRASQAFRRGLAGSVELRYPPETERAMLRALLREPAEPEVAAECGWLTGSEVLLLPTMRRELLALVWRALAGGIPVVAFASKAAREALGIGGLFVDRSAGWRGLAQAVERVAGDATQRESLARRGRAQAKRLQRRHGFETAEQAAATPARDPEIPPLATRRQGAVPALTLPSRRLLLVRAAAESWNAEERAGLHSDLVEEFGGRAVEIVGLVDQRPASAHGSARTGNRAAEVSAEVICTLKQPRNLPDGAVAEAARTAWETGAAVVMRTAVPASAPPGAAPRAPITNGRTACVLALRRDVCERMGMSDDDAAAATAADGGRPLAGGAWTLCLLSPRSAQRLVERNLEHAPAGAWIAGGPVFGGDSRFLLALEDRGQPFALEITPDASVWAGGGGARQRCAGELVEESPPDGWTQLFEPRTAAAIPPGDWARVPLPAPAPAVGTRWLVGRRSGAALTCYLVYCPPQTSLHEMAAAASTPDRLISSVSARDAATRSADRSGERLSCSTTLRLALEMHPPLCLLYPPPVSPSGGGSPGDR